MKNITHKLKNCIMITMISISSAVSAQVTIDPVCGMKVNLAESYDYKYNGKKYSFDTQDCKNVFKINPEKYIQQSCIPANSNIDLVCGLKVDLAESYDWKYNGKIYYFHSHSCRKAFEMDPDKFIENECLPNNTIKKIPVKKEK